MLPLYSSGMADYVLRELEIGPRAASFEDSEWCGWSALDDLSYQQYVNDKEMEMSETQELEQDQDTGPAVLDGMPEPRETSGWLLKVTPKHKCPLPSIDNHTFVGSIWRCGGCGQHYMVGKKRGGAETEKSFRRITEDQAQSKLAAAAARDDD